MSDEIKYVEVKFSEAHTFLNSIEDVGYLKITSEKALDFLNFSAYQGLLKKTDEAFLIPNKLLNNLPAMVKGHLNMVINQTQSIVPEREGYRPHQGDNHVNPDEAQMFVTSRVAQQTELITPERANGFLNSLVSIGMIQKTGTTFLVPNNNSDLDNMQDLFNGYLSTLKLPTQSATVRSEGNRPPQISAQVSGRLVSPSGTLLFLQEQKQIQTDLQTVQHFLGSTYSHNNNFFLVPTGDDLPGKFLHFRNQQQLAAGSTQATPNRESKNNLSPINSGHVTEQIYTIHQSQIVDFLAMQLDVHKSEIDTVKAEQLFNVSFRKEGENFLVPDNVNVRELYVRYRPQQVPSISTKDQVRQAWKELRQLCEVLDHHKNKPGITDILSSAQTAIARVDHVRKCKPLATSPVWDDNLRNLQAQIKLLKDAVRNVMRMSANGMANDKQGLSTNNGNVKRSSRL